MTEPTQALCAFVANASWTDLPDDLLGLAKCYVLDTIGAMIIGSTKPWSRMVTAQALSAGGGRATVVGATAPASPQMAALANGTMGHGFEIDDVHDESLVHPGVVTVPAALAVAEDKGGSGLDFLLSVVLGYEVIARVGLAVGAVPHMLGGFYPTGTNGVFGAAAAAGRLLGSDSATLTQAFGIAGSLASGIVEFAQSGGMVKRLHAGRAAEGGVLAAYLAARGFTGPATVLEGKFGYCRSFSDAPELDRLLEGLGTRFMIREITVKPYTCCSDMHPVIDAMLDVVETHRVSASEVESVLVESTSKLFELNNIDGTTSIMAAQYSVPFTVAATLLHDIRNPALYCEATLASAGIAAMQRRVEMRVSPELDAIYPRVLSARVTVRLRDGREHVSECHGAKGSIHNQLSKAELEAKFRRITGAVIGEKASTEIMHAVETLDRAPDVEALARPLRFGSDDLRDMILAGAPAATPAARQQAKADPRHG